MPATDDFAIRGNQLAGSLGHLLTLLFEIGGEELLVVATGNEADLLRVWLLGKRKAALASHFADLGFGELAEREKGAGKLLLGETEEEVRLILCQVGGPLENPALAGGVVFIDRVVAGGDAACADGAGRLDERVELEVVVAERAGNGRASVEILVDEGTNDVALEAVLLVDDVVRNSQVLGYAAGVVYVIQRTAAAGLGSVWNAVPSGEAGLVPELKGEADDCVSTLGEHGRYR